MTKRLKFPSILTVSFCSALLLFFLPSVTFAQMTMVGEDLATPVHGAGHDFIKMLNETVNPATGSVSIRVDLPMPKGRGLTLPFAIAYDSNGPRHMMSIRNGYANWSDSIDAMTLGGWTYTLPRMNSVTYAYRLARPGVYCYAQTGFVFEDAAGGRHSIPMYTQYWSSLCQTGGTLQSGDPEFWGTTSSQEVGPSTFTDNDGTVYTFPNIGTIYYGAAPSDYYSAIASTVQDRNGNQVTITNSGNGVFSYQDTLGRTVLSSSGFGASGNTISVSGLSGNYTLTWTPFTTNVPGPGSTQIIPDSQCWAPGGSIFTNEMRVTGIELPNGTSYTFQYDDQNPNQSVKFGLIYKIIYPSGGYVRYQWGWNPRSENGEYNDSAGGGNDCQYQYDTPAVVNRYVSFDGVNEVLEQDFSYGPTTWNGIDWTSKTTTVTNTVRTVVNGSLQTLGSYTTTYTYGRVGAVQMPLMYTLWGKDIPVENTITTTDFNGSLLKTVTKDWAYENPYQLMDETVALTGGNTPTKKTSYNYYSGACAAGVTEKDEYDYGAGAPGALLRKTLYTYGDAFTGAGICDRPTIVTIQDGSENQLAQTVYTYDATAPVGTTGITGHVSLPTGTPRGNATTVAAWLNTTGGSLPTNYSYDDTGQILSKTDPLGNITSFSYTDSYTSGSPPGPTNAYLTEITYPTTGTVNHVESFSYSYADGQLTVSTDENHQSTQYTYTDALDRITSITYPDRGQTTYQYWNICGHPSSTTILPNYTETATMDGICNVTQTALTSDQQGTDYTATTYTGLKQVYTVSNPYRSTTESSYGLTTTTYDGIGRTVKVAYPDGSKTTTSYSGNSSTVIDPEGMERILVSDALSRLTSVTEDPTNKDYYTSYTYDALNDLLSVTQSAQTRTFTYDSLKRLLKAINPESGTTTYTYPQSGAMCAGDVSVPCTRKDARSITTTYGYDALNRVLSKTYSNGNPTANFSYDETTITLGSWTSPTLAYPTGRLTHTTTTSGSTILTATVQDYDQMGRTQHYWQCTPLNCGTSSIWAALYNYDAAGGVTSWNHPAGFTITQIINGAREVSQVTSSVNDASDPGTLATVTYTPFGSVSTLLNGCAGSGCTNLLETYFYNPRLQMAVAEQGTAGNDAGHYCWVYNYYVGDANATACSESPSGWPTGTNNNGNVAGYYFNDAVHTGLKHSATYTYDTVNRLSSAIATGSIAYNQTFTYTGDGSTGQYGNLTCAASPAEVNCLAPTYNAANNRITTSGYAYDAAGDVTGDGTYTYTWDAEGRLTKVAQSGTTISTNTYNALGQRVRDVTTSVTTDEAYGADGELLWRYTGSPYNRNQRAFVPLNGAILAEYFGGEPGGTIFDHPGQPHSLSTASDFTGGNFQEHLYYPFGEFWTGEDLHAFSMHPAFNKMPDYDSEIDQYNTLNRHYTPMGRWMAPDPGGLKAVVLEDPQTWNMYAYTRNNPTTFTDPSGLAANFAAQVAGCSEHDPNNCQSETALESKSQTGPILAVVNQTNGMGAAQDPPAQNQEANTAPANSRTDVVLHGREYKPTPQAGTNYFWQMDWKVSACSARSCSQQTAENAKQTITLVESMNGGPWEPKGDPQPGEAHDIIQPQPHTFNQRWFVDGKQVQLVVGKDSNGNLIKTWEVHVVINKAGDRPVYSPVP